MNTPGLLLDTHGRVNHELAHKLGDEELLDVCQLRGCPLPRNLSDEIRRRGLLDQLGALLEAQRFCEDH